MATDFWATPLDDLQSQRWIVDRSTLRQARADDLLYVGDPEYLEFLNIYFANVISKLGKKLQLRQRVIATATVFFRRFYLKSSYCETDPFLVISACCYLAAKAEESPVHIKNVITESRSIFSHHYGVKNFPSDNTKLAEMEFYLVDDLECDLVIFHPYRTLLALCKKEDTSGVQSLIAEAEAGEVGAGVAEDDGPRYWGLDGAKLELSEGALQTAWFIINDTYRSELCLLYPPHLIAIAAIYLTFILHGPTQTTIAPLLPSSNSHSDSSPTPSSEDTSQPRRSSRQSHPPNKKPHQDPISFLAGLNVSMQHIATIAQEIISLYSLWDRYREDSSPDASSSSSSKNQHVHRHSPFHSPSKRSATSAGLLSSTGTPEKDDVFGDSGSESDMTCTPAFLTKLLLRMREQRIADLAHPASGKPVAVNKMLERTQAAG
ncbi:RNA polymerase II holoenzyme cyclin-like subunit [Marasmius tenuissimus]|uniref:RNA polymerase II holoenzyme cyclin-like subunit n=1 Tax=Marasmius tenuissimus TaxID=585030 RepID=A0ABR2ZA11_9AGAR